MDDLKECREAFEVWWQARFPADGRNSLHADALAFEVWQAAWNRRAVPQANAEQDAARDTRHRRNPDNAQAAEKAGGLSDDDLWKLAMRHGLHRVNADNHDGLSWRMAVLMAMRGVLALHGEFAVLNPIDQGKANGAAAREGE